jgi:hypothetical protein
MYSFKIISSFDMLFKYYQNNMSDYILLNLQSFDMYNNIYY